MKILITGSEGQVGSEIVKLCKQKGIQHSAHTKHTLDITNKDQIRHAIMSYKPTIILNAAAFTKVEMAETHEKLSYEVNTLGAKNLAEFCRDFSILLLHISTDFVFNGKAKKPYSESDSTDPINIYGKTKNDGEGEIRSITKKHIIVRTSWVFSAKGDNFVNTIIKLAKKNEQLDIVDDQYGSPTSAISIAQTLLVIIKKYEIDKNFEFGTYHFSGYPECTWFDFAENIIKIAYENDLITTTPKLNRVSSEDYKTISTKPKYSVLSCEKINNVFSIQSSKWINDLSKQLIKNL